MCNTGTAQVGTGKITVNQQVWQLLHEPWPTLNDHTYTLPTQPGSQSVWHIHYTVRQTKTV